MRCRFVSRSSSVCVAKHDHGSMFVLCVRGQSCALRQRRMLDCSATSTLNRFHELSDLASVAHGEKALRERHEVRKCHERARSSKIPQIRIALFSRRRIDKRCVARAADGDLAAIRGRIVALAAVGMTLNMHQVNPHHTVGKERRFATKRVVVQQARSIVEYDVRGCEVPKADSAAWLAQRRELRNRESKLPVPAGNR